MPLLDVRGLEKYYGRRKVVDGVSFDVNQGEIVGLLGPNGAGKTTSFRMTIGLIDSDGGQVLFDGQDVTRLPMFNKQSTTNTIPNTWQRNRFMKCISISVFHWFLENPGGASRPVAPPPRQRPGRSTARHPHLALPRGAAAPHRAA